MKTAPIQRPALASVLEEHCEELGFLRVQRRGLPFSSGTRPVHLVKASRRIAAHKAALAIAPGGASGAAQRRAAKVARTTRDPFQWSAAMETRIESEPGREAALWAALCEAGASLASAAHEALRHVGGEALGRMVRARHPLADAPAVLAAQADAVAYRLGFAPGDDVPGLALPTVRRAFARGLGAAQGGPEVRRALRALCDDDAEDVRRGALWSLFLHDPREGAALARERTADPFALRVLGVAGCPTDLERIAHALIPDVTRHAAIAALGELGCPRAAGWLADLAREAQPFSALAAEALTRLAGEATHGVCLADALAEQVARVARIEPDVRLLRGRPFAAIGGHETLEALWLAAVNVPAAAEKPALAALRREVPSGFFRGAPLHFETPGDGPWS